MNSVEDLDVFKLAHQLALKTYAATKAFPKEELFSLGDQTRRDAGRRHSFRRLIILETWKSPPRFILLKRLERSEAVERLERFEPASVLCERSD
jgi:hypothetical protein